MPHKHPRGYSALTFVIVMTTVIIGIGIVVSTSLRSSTTQALRLADRNAAASASFSCLDEAHLRLTRDRSYEGGQLNLGSTLCTMTVSQQGAVYTIIATGSQNGAIRTYLLELDDETGTLSPLRQYEQP